MIDPGAQPSAESGGTSGGTGTLVLAYFFGALGVVAVIAGAIQTAGVLRNVAGPVLNPVFGNPRRLPYLETLEHLASNHVTNFFLILPWYVILVLLALFFVALLQAFFRRAPGATLTAAIFLAGSVIVGLLIGTSVLKVGEFAVQAAGAATAEQEWVAAGINYLNQVHLFYVFGWFLCVALGWIFLGLGAASAMDRTVRLGARMVLAGGVVVAVTVLARSWLPTYGADAPAVVVAMGEPLATFGIGVGLIGCTFLWLGMTGEAKRQPRAVTHSPAGFGREL